MITMKNYSNRKKAIIHRRDCNEDFKVSLTEDQINLLTWLLNEDIICADDYDLQVLDEADRWEEI